VLANVFAWPLGYLLGNRLLQGFAFRTPLSLDVFAFTGAAAVLLAGLTVSLQTFKAARTDPVETLRYE
jgi:putative ABC transport system permease protein